MLYDLSDRFHLFEKNKKDALERIKDEPDTLEYFKNLKLENVLYEITTGIYETGLNFDHYLTDWFDIEGVLKYDALNNFELRGLEGKKYLSTILQNCKEQYGVADNAEQVIEMYKSEIESKDDLYIISLCSIRKDEQPEDGGWRWHKWGEYIGNQNPQYEYIYDEPEIEEVFVYHIYKIIPNIKEYIENLVWLSWNEIENEKHIDINRIHQINTLELSNKDKNTVWKSNIR